MGWMQKLCETYDNNLGFVADYTKDEPLCPPSHMFANSQIEITVDIDGNFRGAKREDRRIIIPVTEESAGRASGIAPHGLSDNLSYVAGDFKDYIDNSKSQKVSGERSAQYIKNLKTWSESEYSNAKVKAIYTYLSKRSVTKDLLSAGVMEAGDDGKIQAAKYEKNIACFIVSGSEHPQETWMNRDLIDLYQKYYIARKKGKSVTSLCYLTAEEALISGNHPKGILASSYGAKLLSSNDMNNFTFRGRFTKPEEAYTVSYEASQKAHNTLAWLAKMQGFSVGGANDRRTYICWNPKGKELPPIDQFPGIESDEDNTVETMPQYKQKIKRAFNGYHENLAENDDVVIMALEAATTGRLSITYYNELTASDFLERLENWHETCCWGFTTYDNAGKRRQKIFTPLTYRIVDYAFGTQQSELVKAGEKVMIMQYQRILHCILNKQPLPRDIVEAIFRKASNPLAYKKGNREKVLSTACALIAKYYNDNKGSKGVKIGMELDRTNNDRSYLFGRLLAVYEKAERRTFNKDETRETNAIRIQASYVQHPMNGMGILDKAVNPYMEKLSRGSGEFYKNLIGEIIGLFKEEDMPIMNRNLEDLYLIGYYLQREELRKSKEKVETEA